MPEIILAITMFAAGVAAGLFWGSNKREHLRGLIEDQAAEIRRLTNSCTAYKSRNKFLAETLYYRKAQA